MYFDMNKKAWMDLESKSVGKDSTTEEDVTAESVYEEQVLLEL